MTQRSADAGEPRRPPQPGAGGGGQWPDELWPDDGTAGSGPGQPGPPWAAAPPPPAHPPGRPGRPRPAALVLTALAAAAAGALIMLAVRGFAGRPPAAVAPPAGQPSVLPGGQAGPVSGLPGSGTGSIVLIGTVTAVSRASVTIGGAGPSVTGAVTSATRVTGKTASIGGVRPGDHVSAQFTQSGGKTTAVAIQDPAQAPGGGTLP